MLERLLLVLHLWLEWEHNMAMHNVSLHRALKHLHEGGLHEALHIPAGEKIPEDRLEAARNSKNLHVKKMAEMAHTMEGWSHKKED